MAGDELEGFAVYTHATAQLHQDTAYKRLSAPSLPAAVRAGAIAAVASYRYFSFFTRFIAVRGANARDT